MPKPVLSHAYSAFLPDEVAFSGNALVAPRRENLQARLFIEDGMLPSNQHNGPPVNPVIAVNSPSRGTT